MPHCARRHEATFGGSKPPSRGSCTPLSLSTPKGTRREKGEEGADGLEKPFVSKPLNTVPMTQAALALSQQKATLGCEQLKVHHIHPLRVGVDPAGTLLSRTGTSHRI